ncbi:MAG: SGNH/GDSL hydrolase family protein [Deltaproteobacteria bacterium]|nr:SGNH/GDSL hydrolase family protein [Deltaproteobacteria bacterium]
MKKFCRLLGVVVLSVVMFSGITFAATPFSNVVVFGDSLSDNGNIFALSGGAQPHSSHAYKGRWSNGPVWIEYLAKYFSAGLTDLAEGGATTGDETSLPVGLQKQVADFITLASSYPTMISDETLFVVWAGPNDFLSGGTDYLGAVDNIETALDMLAVAGVKHLLVANMPNLGATPGLNPNPVLSESAKLLTQAFNATLEGSVDNFKQTYTSISVYYFDVYALFAEVIADPESYGFTDVTNAYVNDDDTVNDDGEIYLFWDSVHPMTLAHKLLAKKAADFVDGASAAWYTSSGLLNIPQVFANGFNLNYNVVLEHVGTMPSDSANTYFKLKSLKSN